MKTVLMYGPAISDKSQMVERDVPEQDINAYRAAGYRIGQLPEAYRPKPVEEKPVQAVKTGKK